ncbi:YncE family protein [Streptomyces sp. enrichment culture]|uniref:YncE family protein n=1 Tax=Streptomyces sp. enrichment culture TaxID=1795815 RepID=UPI003F56893B
MRRRTLTTATALAVLLSSATLAAVPASADTTRPLPVRATGDIVVDGVHHRVFVSDPVNGKIVVTDYAGTVVKQLFSLPGVTGLELSADSATLYAAVKDADAIVAVDTATGTETARHPVGDAPRSVARAGGRLWFGYGAAGAGNIGSLDLSGEQPVVTLDQDPTRLWYSAPLLDAAPGANTLVAGGGESTAVLASYDVTSGTATRLAATSEFGSNLGDLQVTPDGQDVVVATSWPSQHHKFNVLDLTADGRYVTSGGGNSVAIAADGTLAAGASAWYDPDIYVYKPGSTTSVREYDFPNTGMDSGGDDLQSSGLAWAPGVPRLFAIVANDQGQYTLRVLTTPTRATTALTVDAPATAARAKRLTVKGTVTSRVKLPTGAQLTVTRTDLESPNGKALQPVTVRSDGTYSFTDVPPAGGKVRYTVRYAGDADHTAASASDSVQVSRATPVLTLTNNRKVYAFGADVRFTAHLGTTYKNRKVEIWADPFGGDRPNRLVKSGVVNSSGNLSVVLDLRRDTKVVAKFAGDARYKPRTVTSTVGTRVKISTALSGQYKKQYTWGHTYHFFKKTRNPLVTTVMSPYPGRSQRLEFQIYYQGTWYDAGSEYFKLSSTGVSRVEFLGPHEAGWRWRVRSVYLEGPGAGDRVNTTTNGAWKYLYFTS